MKRAKKWLAGALAVLLLVNLLPASALAEEENAGEETAVEQVETLGEEDTLQTEEPPADSEPDTDVGTADPGDPADPGDLGGSTRQDVTADDIVVTDGVAEVRNYAGFAAAVADDAVQSIRIIGSVVIPENTTLDAGSKEITVCESGRLELAPGAVLTSSAPMGQFSYEDGENTWTHIAEGMAAFLLWLGNDDNVYRELHGTQAEDLNSLLTDHGSLNTAVFRDDVTLTAGNATIRTLVMMGKNTALTIQNGASLTIEGYLHVEDGSLHVLPGGSLVFGDEGEGWVNGDVEFRDGQPPEMLHWGGADLWPHLVALEYDYESDDPTALRWGDFRSKLWMTPLDEPEVVFGFLYFDESEDVNDWRFDLDITVDRGGLTYQQREDQERRWYLSGAEWNRTYNITYTAADSAVYTLPVYSYLPELGYYKAPKATEDNYINCFDYTPGNDTFYLCVNPNAWFLKEDGISLADPELTWGDRDKIFCQPVEGETGVWKITVSGGEFWAEYQVDILRNDQWDGDIRCGIEIREGNYPHLVALDYDYDSDDPTAVRTEYYHNAYWITPTYEPELVFAFLHEENGRWTFDTDITVTIRDTTTEDGTCGLTYEARDDRDGRMVLSGAEWDHTYEVSYTAKDGATYTLPVHVVLPTAGYYKAPAATKEAFINHWAYIPNSENEFYLCVDPNEWFMQEEGITLADPELVRGDPERVSCQPVEGKTGVWKITVTGWDFDIEYELRAFRGEEEVYQDRCGLWIEMGKYPHLVVLDYDYDSDDPLAVRTDHYSDALSMTPGDEPELVFAFMYEEDGQWKFDTNIAVNAGGLTYEARDDRDGRMVLSGAEWDKTYTVSYTAADSTVYTLPVYVELPDLGFYSTPEVSRETYINRFDYTPLSPNEFYLCVNPNAWFMQDLELSLGELALQNAGDGRASFERIGEGVWKITVYDCEFSVELELPVLRNGNKEWSMGRGIWVSAGEQLVWSTQLLTEVTGESWDVDYDSSMPLSNTLTLYPDSSQDVALYLLVYYGPDEQNGHGKWVCEYTGSEWVRGEGVTVEGAEDSPLCRVSANAVGTQSIVRLDGEDTGDGYQPIPDSTRGIPLTVMVEERNLPVEIDWNARTARLTNEMNEPIAVQMLLAAYDADGRMCGVNANAGHPLRAGESLKVTVDVPQGVEVAKLKVFVLDPETRKPLRQAVEDKYVPSLTIDASGTVSGGTYRNITVTAAVGDGEVVLEDVTILGDLIIQGGGSGSIKLHSCAVNGKVVLDKTTTDESSQQPRLELTDTPVSRVVARQPAIIEAADAVSSVQEVKATASVEIKGAKTVVDLVKALAPVTITAGKVNTVAVVDDKVPSGTQVAVTVGSGASVGEVAVHAAAGAAITNNGTIQAVSAANSAVADKVDRKGPSATPTPATHIHSWDYGVMNRQPTCNTPGQLTRTCTVGDCGAQKKTTVPALGHDYRTNFESDETGHWHVCNRCGEHGRKNAHVYGDDYICDICGYRNATVYPVFIRHTVEELGFVKDALVVENGEITVLGEAVGPNGELWIPPVRDGWSHKGWGILVTDDQYEEIFRGCFTEMTEVLERALLDAIDHGYRIFMDATAYAEGIGANGFSVTLDKSSGDLAYTLNVPGDGDDMYYLNLISMDRAEAYSCSVWKDEGYTGTVWALLPASGYYGAFEVMDADGKLVAASQDFFPGFTAQLNSGDLADCDKPVVTINYDQSDATTIVYEISGLTTMMNYQLADLDENGEGDVYFLGMKDGDGKVSLSTAVNNPLSRTVTLYGVAAFYINWYGMEIAKPITLKVPAYDPDHTGDADLKALVDEAVRLGLLPYADANSFVVDGQVTRLDASMLAAALMGLTPADAAGMTWSFTDGADLTADQKALIMLLVEEGVIAGYPDGSFGPEKPLTNAAIVKILDRVLDHPVVPITRTNNLDPDAWYYLPFTMLDNVGVLDGTDLDVKASARMQDMLRVCINAKNWRDQNPGNPEYPVSALKFSGISLNWTAPTLDSSLNRNELRYKVIIQDQYGSFRSTTRENSLYLFDMVGGEYDRVIIRTYYGDRFCGQYETNALSITVEEKFQPAASVSFTPNSDGSAYHVSITGMTPGVAFNLALGEEVGNCGIGIGDTADAAGAFEDEISVQNFPELKDCVESGGFYLLREYPSIKSTSTTLEMTITNRGDWTPCDPGAYQVTDIRFEGQYLKWNGLNANIHYQVRLSEDGGQSWVDNCGTNDAQVAFFSFGAGTYNKVRIETWVDGELKAFAEQFIDLRVNQNPNEAIGSAQVNFQLKTDQRGNDYYEMTVTGLNPAFPYILAVANRPENWNERNFRDVVPDANGTAVAEIYDTGLVRTGYYQIIRGDCAVNDKTVAKANWSFVGDPARCFVPTNTVWFEENDGYLNLCFDYEYLTDYSDYECYMVEFYNETTNTWEHWGRANIHDTRWFVNNPDSRVGTYNRVRLIAHNGPQGDKKWFDASIKLTVTEEAGAPSATVTKLSNGEHQFLITGLVGSRNSTVEVMNSLVQGYGDCYGNTTPVNGNGEVYLTVDWPYVANGYYHLREYTNVVGSGTTASFGIREGAWIKCFSGDPVSYQVTDIRFEGQYLKWTEPTAVQGMNVHYRVELSKDGGQSWTEGCGSGEPQVAHYAFREGSYNKVRILTEYNGNVLGTAYADISLKVSQKAMQSSSAMVSFKLVEDGRRYEMTVTGLKPNTSHILSVMNRPWNWNERSFREVVSDAQGNATVRFGNIELVEKGYYSVIELLDCSVPDSATAVCGWAYLDVEGKCVDTCGHTVSNTKPVSNIRAQSSWIRWDASGANGDVYEIRLSEDGGQSWLVREFVDGGTQFWSLDLPEGHYNAVQIRTLQRENCGCYVEVGKKLDTDFRLTVTEMAAATPAAVIFTPVNGVVDTYSFTITGLQPNGDYDLELAMDANGNQRRGGYGGPSADGSGKAVRENLTAWNGADFTMQDVLENGYYRLTEFKMNESTGTLTRITHGTWTKSVIVTPTYRDTAWFEIKPDGLYLCWDYTPMQNAADHADGYSLYLNFGTETNPEWRRVNGIKNGYDFVRINTTRIEEGVYTGIRMVGRVGSTEPSTWFEQSCLLTITDGGASTAKAGFVANADGTYNVEVSGLDCNSQVAEVVVSGQEGLGNIDYMVHEKEGNTSWLFEGKVISYPNGYYRIREYANLTAQGLTAGFSIAATGWTKVNDDAVTDTRTPVPAVTGFAFEESPVALWLRMQLPVDMNNIDRFRVEFRDTNGNWVDCGTCGGGMPIQGDRMDGTYNRIRITSIPKNDSKYQPGVYEAACNLIIANMQDTALSDVAFYSIANATPQPGYSVQVRGLEPDTKQVVVQLAERDNGEGRREELGGDNFFDENGTKGVSCTSFGSYLTDYFPGRYYRVLEVKDASVTDASTAYLKVKTRGGWSQITLAGSLTYEPVTGLQLRNGGGYPELAWENPANQPIGARYQVFISRDGGVNWLGGSKTDMNFMKPYLYEQGTYNKVKVATVVNGMEVAASTLNINLQVTADAQTSNAQLKLTPVGGDEYLCEVTGLKPNTPFAVFFKNQDGTSKREIGTPWSDSNGAFRGVLRLKTSALEYWYIQEFISCSVANGTTASCTVRNTSGWQPVTLAPAVTYQAVSNLHFRMRNYPELTWDIPADQPAGACYRTYLSSNDGATWQQVGKTTERNFLVPFVYEQGTYNMAKVVTVVNGREVAHIAASINLTITEGAALPAAPLTLTPLAGGGYDCQVTGLTAQTPFTLYFKNAADTENDVVGTPMSDGSGTFKDTLRINSRVAELYYIQEYSNSNISPDGMTAAFTVTNRGGWQPVTML